MHRSSPCSSILLSSVLRRRSRSVRMPLFPMLLFFEVSRRVFSRTRSTNGLCDRIRAARRRHSPVSSDDSAYEQGCAGCGRASSPCRAASFLRGGASDLLRIGCRSGCCRSLPDGREGTEMQSCSTQRSYEQECRPHILLPGSVSVNQCVSLQVDLQRGSRQVTAALSQFDESALELKARSWAIRSSLNSADSSCRS